MSKVVSKPFWMCGPIKNLGCELREDGGIGVTEDKSMAQHETVPDKQDQDAGSSMEKVSGKHADKTEVTLTTPTALDDNPMWQMIARRCPDEW